MFFKSFANATNHLTLLSYDGWEDDKTDEYVYYRDIYIENQKNFSDELIVTAPARAPQSFLRNGYMT